MATSKQVERLTSRADSGDSESQYKLAQHHLAGNGVEINIERAHQLIESAAKLGHLNAIYLLGVWAQTGERGPEDPARAVQLYEQAGNEGHLNALLNLGILTQVGIGTPMDMLKARDIYTRAAEAGSGQAAANLGKLYEAGALSDGESDYPMAIHWYRKSIKLGFAEARTALEAVHAAMGVPSLMTGEVRPKSASFWKRILGLR